MWPKPRRDYENRLVDLLWSLFDCDHRYEVIETFSRYAAEGFRHWRSLSDPDIWVLDEPMTGLDPQAAFDLKQLPRAHADKGKNGSLHSCLK